MNPRIITTLSLRQTICYVEWICLIFAGLVVVFTADFNHFQAKDYLVTFASLIAFALLGFIFPIDRPLWQKRGYIFLEMLIIIPSRIVGWDFDVLLCLVIAKSCFLLNLKDVAFTVVATGVTWQMGLVWRLPGAIEFMRSHIADLNDPKRIITASVITSSGVYVVESAFVVLFSLMVIAERNSRQKALALAQQVETLAATLERTRIARDIHDSLGHTLTTLDVQLELAQTLHLAHDSHQEIQTCLDTAKLLSSQCLIDVRRALSTMRQSDFNFDAALLTLIEKVKQNQALTIHLQMNLPKLPLQISHQLYCIIQEGLTNVQKHALASEVNLWGCTTSDSMIIELTDNGKGFDMQAPHSGFGLRGMQERVQILGGRLTINSVPGQGTRIQVIIPL